MLQALDDNSDALDEAFLSSCFAYIKKASDDGLSEIVYVLQRILQLYAARHWSQADAGGKDDAMLLDILAADEKNWQNMIHDLASAGVPQKPQERPHYTGLLCAYKLASCESAAPDAQSQRGGGVLAIRLCRPLGMNCA